MLPACTAGKNADFRNNKNRGGSGVPPLCVSCTPELSAGIHKLTRRSTEQAQSKTGPCFPSQPYGTAGVLFRADEHLVTRPAMKLSQARKRWRVFLVGLVLAGGSIVVFRSEPLFIPLQASVQFLSSDSKIPVRPVSLFERWIPISWGWLWRLHDGIRGPLATILIDAK